MRKHRQAQNRRPLSPVEETAQAQTTVSAQQLSQKHAHGTKPHLLLKDTLDQVSGTKGLWTQPLRVTWPVRMWQCPAEVSLWEGQPSTGVVEWGPQSRNTSLQGSLSLPSPFSPARPRQHVPTREAQPSSQVSREAPHLPQLERESHTSRATARTTQADHRGHVTGSSCPVASRQPRLPLSFLREDSQQRSSTRIAMGTSSCCHHAADRHTFHLYCSAAFGQCSDSKARDMQFHPPCAALALLTLCAAQQWAAHDQAAGRPWRHSKGEANGILCRHAFPAGGTQRPRPDVSTLAADNS